MAQPVYQFVSALRCAKRRHARPKRCKELGPWTDELVSPVDIRFTQRNCAGWFGLGSNLGDELQALVEGTKSEKDHQMIRIVWDGNFWYSLDNRRLALWRLYALFHEEDFRLQVRAFSGSPQRGRELLCASGKMRTRNQGACILVNDAEVVVGRTRESCVVL